MGSRRQWPAGNHYAGRILSRDLLTARNTRPTSPEDKGQVVALNEFGHIALTLLHRVCVRTKRMVLCWNPGTDKKWYAKGIGLVRIEFDGRKK